MSRDRILSRGAARAASDGIGHVPQKSVSEALARLVTPDLASGVPVGGGTMDGSGSAITSLWSLGYGRAANTVAEPQRVGGEGG